MLAYPSFGAIGNVGNVAVSGSTLTISSGADTVVVQVCKSNILRVNYLPSGKASPPTPMLGTTNWVPVDVAINTASDPMVMATSNMVLRISKYPCRLSVYDASGSRLLIKEQGAEGVFADGIKLDHPAGADFYGISGYRNSEASSAGMLRNSGGYVESGYQGDCGAPLAWTRAGYGVLVDSDGGQFDLAGTNLVFQYCSRTNIEYFILTGSPRDIMSSVAEVSGKPPMFPKYSLGFMNFEWGITQGELTNIVNTYRAKQIPLDLYILDFDWKAWSEDNYGEWRWNTTKFPGGPSGAVRDQLAAKGVQLGGIMKPRIHVNTVQGNYATTNGFWYPGESTYQDYFDVTYGRSAYSSTVCDVNFAMPACRTWYWDHSTNAFATGIRNWWNDEADQSGSFTYSFFFDNFQFLNMQKCLYEGQRSYSTQRVWSVNRTFYLGCQRYAYGNWSGDIEGGFGWMTEQRERMLSSVNLGAVKWGMDIGGLWNGSQTTPECYARWMQFGAFVPVYRVHGAEDNQRQPWVYGATAEAAAKSAIQLRYRLLPYIYSYERQATETGLGIVRPLFYDYPQDPNVANYKDAWMFGDYLLAAPVVEAGQTVKSIYLPAGTWTDFGRGTVYAGGQTIAYSVNSTTWTDIPLFIKQGAILPTQPVLNYVGERTVSNVYVDVFPATDQTSFTYYDDDGQSYAYESGRFFRQTMTAQDLEGVTFTVSSNSGSYTPPLQYYLCRFHCRTNQGVTIDGAAPAKYASAPALEAAPGEGWAEGINGYGYTVYVKLAAGLARTVFLSNNLVESPAITPAGGSWPGAVTAAVTCATPGAEIRYTLDNLEPSELSPLYTAPIKITASTTLRARAFKPGRAPSATAVAAFTVDENLLNNPGWETAGDSTNNAQFWVNGIPDNHAETWGAARRVNWRSHEGAWQGALRGLWADEGSLAGAWQEVPATGGATYRFSAWFWADSTWSAGSQEMKLEFLAGTTRGETYLRTVTNKLSGLGETWTLRTLEATAPANATWVRVVILSDAVGANGALQFDDLRLERTDLRALMVRSEYGRPAPAAGVSKWAAGSTLTNSVTSPVVTSLFQYVCTGWSLSGNNPAGGTGTVAVLTLTNQAVLEWNWVTNPLVAPRFDFEQDSYAAAESDGSALVTVVRSAGTNGAAAVDVLTEGGDAIAGVDYLPVQATLAFADGETSKTFAVTILNDFMNEPMKTMGLVLRRPSAHAELGARTNAVVTLTDDDAYRPPQILQISSPYGEPDPVPGVTTNPYGMALVCRLAGSPATQNGTQYVNIGWSGSGSVQATGSATSTPTFFLTNDTVVAWLWNTNLHFQRNAGAGGSVSGSASGWYALGSSVTVTATPADSYRFAGWSGEVTPAERQANPLALTLQQQRSVTAMFVANTATNLLFNPGFETAGSSSNSASYWQAGQPNVHGEMWGTGRRVNWRARGGSWAGALRGRWANEGALGGFWQEVAAVPGRAYKLSGWFWADSTWQPAHQRMKLEFLSGDATGSNYLLVVTNDLLNIGQAWTNLSIQATAPVNATWVRAVILSDDVSLEGALQFDDFRLEYAGQYALTVNSPHGAPEPVQGIYTYNPGTVLTNRVNALETQGATQYVCAGWSLTGHQVSNGQTNLAVVVLTNDAVLTWNWLTRYQLDVAAEGSGTVTAATGWKDAGSQAVVTAAPASSWRFAGWGGDTNGCAWTGGVLVADMTRGRTLTARFEPDTFVLSVTSTRYGSVTPQGAVQVAPGGDAHFMIQADPFCSIAEIRTNGALLEGTWNPQVHEMTWSNVTADGDLWVRFTPAVTTNNGTPEFWLDRHGLTNEDFATASELDQDGDHMATWQEYVAGCDPTNPASYFAPTAQPDVQGTILTWPSAEGRVYNIYSKTNLSDAAWTLVTHDLPAGSVENVWTGAPPNGIELLYYRVTVRTPEQP